MQLINAVIFVVCSVIAIDALKCHMSNPGGMAGYLVDVSGDRYTWTNTNRKFDACYMYANGRRGFDERGDIDYACFNGTSGALCFCATDGCNAEMPDINVHMTPAVNCLAPRGRAYTCGGNSDSYGMFVAQK